MNLLSLRCAFENEEISEKTILYSARCSKSDTSCKKMCQDCACFLLLIRSSPCNSAIERYYPFAHAGERGFWTDCGFVLVVITETGPFYECKCKRTTRCTFHWVQSSVTSTWNDGGD